ncbi:NfeD family protein [Albitalea terrae]|uniref:NfeD family protein n=1 Tax=Piscinibacter terrae TaxID=2496871 RepID=A0A3N7HMU7_9BURK|nr:NfeD family protein [Albitalea terrae]
MSASTVWWLLAGVAVAAELTTGTFYLLMVALGLAAGALAAHAGLAASIQLVAASVIGGGATVLWHWKRSRMPQDRPVPENRDVNLDIGERVQVPAWEPDGTARVAYRGSTWSARLQPGAAAAPGLHRVAAVEGNWLVLAPASN